MSQDETKAGSELDDQLGATETCTWAEDSDGVWNAACPPVGEHSFCFTEDGPTENGFKFCPYCGKPLVASAFDPNAD